jgi:hypothetical protein
MKYWLQDWLHSANVGDEIEIKGGNPITKNNYKGKIKVIKIDNFPNESTREKIN